jgi:hypothetical protein
VEASDYRLLSLAFILLFSPSMSIFLSPACVYNSLCFLLAIRHSALHRKYYKKSVRIYTGL